MSDTISRQAAIDAVFSLCEDCDSGYCGSCRVNYPGEKDVIKVIRNLPPAQPEQRWILFKTRPLTKEEKEEHPEWDGILDCKLPDDGQRILVNVSVRGHESVQYDEFYTDDGSYLDSGYEIGTEATAWMPLPEPYEPEQKEVIVFNRIKCCKNCPDRHENCHSVCDRYKSERVELDKLNAKMHEEKRKNNLIMSHQMEIHRKMTRTKLPER